MGTAWFGREPEGEEERGDARGFHQRAQQGTVSSDCHGLPEVLSTEAPEEGLKVCTRCQQGQDGAKKQRLCQLLG